MHHGGRDGQDDRARGLGALLAAALVACDAGEDEPRPEPPTLAERYQSLFDLDEDLTVGQSRYVAACQVLTDEIVLPLTGDPVDGTNTIRGTFIEQSVPEAYLDSHSRGLETSCTIDNGRTKVVSLNLSQVNRSDDDLYFEVDYLADEASELMDERVLTADLASLGDPADAEWLIEQFTRGVEFAGQSYEDAHAQIEAGEAPTVVVLPDGFDDLSITGLHGDLTYRLRLPTWEFPDSPAGEAQRLDVLARLMRGVLENLDDPGLSQSIVSPVRGADVRFGETPIVEPCAVFTADVMRESFGVAPDVVAERWTPSLDLDQPDDRGVAVPHGRCARTFHARDAEGKVPDEVAKLVGNHGWLRAELVLGHFRSPQEARDHFFAEEGGPGTTGEAVTDLGDEAAYRPGGGTLWVLHGAYVFSFGGFPDHSDKKPGLDEPLESTITEDFLNPEWLPLDLLVEMARLAIPRIDEFAAKVPS